MRATADDPISAAGVGMNVRRLHVIAFMIGAGLAGTAGALTVTFTAASPSIGNDFIIIMFLSVVLGGLGSVFGAALGAFGVGVVQSLSGLILPLAASERDALHCFRIGAVSPPARAVWAASADLKHGGHATVTCPDPLACIAYAPPLIVFTLFLSIVSQVLRLLFQPPCRIARILGRAWHELEFDRRLCRPIVARPCRVRRPWRLRYAGVATAIRVVPWIGLVRQHFRRGSAAFFVGVTLRLSGIYFALATLAYPLILQVLFTYWGYQEALIPARPASAFSVHAMAR